MVSILVALAVTVLIIGMWLVRKSSEEGYTED
jgi:phosphate starvation-inducible membrane PsiE